MYDAPLTVYPLTPDVQARLERTFTYHPPAGDQAQRYTLIREEALSLARRLCQCCPPSRELSLALTHLEEAVMFANAAIARNEEEPHARK